MKPGVIEEKITHDVQSLSRRELQVIALLAEGHPKRKISTHLRIAESTVATHVSHIFDKLHVSNAAGAVGKAFRCGILGPDY